MKYEIIGGNTLDMLEDEVNKKIKLGYILIGGISNYPNAVGCVFQAMIKDKNIW